MAPITSRVQIARPPDVVFAFATDPANFSSWQDDVESARLEGQGPARPGSTFVTVRRTGPGTRPMRQKVTVSEPPTRWSARGVDGPVRPVVEMVLEPVEGGNGSRVTVTMDFEGRGIGRLLVPLVIRRLAAKRTPVSYERLKQVLEDQRWVGQRRHRAAVERVRVGPEE